VFSIQYFIQHSLNITIFTHRFNGPSDPKGAARHQPDTRTLRDGSQSPPEKASRAGQASLTTMTPSPGHVYPAFTCLQPRHRRRRAPVGRVARPQLPGVAVHTPTDRAAVRQQSTRVVGSRGKGEDACGKRNGVRRHMTSQTRTLDNETTYTQTHTHSLCLGYT
jgi:hypothetical protein